MPLHLPVVRRVVGVLINALIMIVGLAEVMFPQGFVGAAPSGISLETAGSALLAVGALLSPFILFPCLMDRYPLWVERLPEATLKTLKQLIGAK